MKRERLADYEFMKPVFGEVRYKLDGPSNAPYCIWNGGKWVDVSQEVGDLVRAIANHCPKAELVEAGKNNYYRFKLGGGVASEEKLRNDAKTQWWDFDAEVSSEYLIPVQWDTKTQSWRDI